MEEQSKKALKKAQKAAEKAAKKEQYKNEKLIEQEKASYLFNFL